MTPRRSAGLFTSHSETWLLAAFLCVGLGVRWSGWAFRSGDLELFVLPWFADLKIGGFRALANNGSDYSAPYNLLLLAAARLLPDIPDILAIKLISWICDIPLAAGCLKIARLLDISERSSAYVFGITFLLPTVVLNSGWWGQSDALYSALLVWGLVAVLTNRSMLASLAFAVSLSIKPQAAFLIPFGIVMMVWGKLRWPHLLLIPIVYVVLAALPSALAGKKLTDALLIYSIRTGPYDAVCPGLPNPYCFLRTYDYDTLKTVGLFALSAFCLASLIFAWRLRNRQFDNRAIVFLALYSAYLVPWLAPNMRERYQFFPEVIAVPLAFASAQALPIPILLQAITVSTYTIYLLRTHLFSGAGLALITAESILAAYLQFVGAWLLGLGGRQPQARGERARAWAISLAFAVGFTGVGLAARFLVEGK